MDKSHNPVNDAWYMNDPQFFSIFLRYTKSGTIVVYIIHKRSSGLDLTFESHIQKKKKNLNVWTILQTSKNLEQLKFGPLPFFGLLNLSNGLDHELWSHDFKKEENNGLPYKAVHFTVAWSYFRFRR